MLSAHVRSPTVALNRAVAMRSGPEAGLALLDKIEGSPDRSHLLPATRADLLRQMGRPAEAAESYRAALDRTANESECAYLRRRLAGQTVTAERAGRRTPGR